MIVSGFPRGIESIELWNRFSRPWTDIEFSENINKVWKSQIQPFVYSYFLYRWWQFCIVFHAWNFVKMNMNGCIKFLSFGIEKVLKKYGKWFLKMCGNPVGLITKRRHWLKWYFRKRWRGILSFRYVSTVSSAFSCGSAASCCLRFSLHRLQRPREVL